MRRDAVAADRAREVHRAARAWYEAGAIDDAAQAAVESRFPDDRARLGLAFRVLAFFFAIVGIGSTFGVLMLGVSCGRADEAFVASVCLIFGIALAAGTEVLVGPMRRADSGVEAATALMSVGFTVGGATWVADQVFHLNGGELTVFLALGAVACTLGAWRWGFAFLAVFAAAAAFGVLARLPAGRALWLVAAAVLTFPLLSAVDSPRLAPSHRRGAQAVLMVVVIATYVAVHLGSIDHGLIEIVADWDRGGEPPAGGLRTLSVLATALMPPALLLLAVVTRRVPMIRVAVLLGVASLVTLRFYISVAPLWVVLLLSGAAALLVVLAVRRGLASGEEGERAGFTPEPLFEDRERREAMEMMAAAALAPGARALPADGGKIDPGGGRYGGGGASDQY